VGYGEGMADTGRLTRAGTGDEHVPGESCRRHERAAAAALLCHSVVVAEMHATGCMVGQAMSRGLPGGYTPGYMTRGPRWRRVFSLGDGVLRPLLS